MLDAKSRTGNRKRTSAPDDVEVLFKEVSRRRPTLPGSCPPSTIGVEGLNDRVRDGNGCDPFTIATGNFMDFSSGPPLSAGAGTLTTEQRFWKVSLGSARMGSSPRPISTGQLKRLPVLHPRPINQMFCLGSYQVDPVGDLILGKVSRLDAFSAYPSRTWLPSYCPWRDSWYTRGPSIPVLSY